MESHEPCRYDEPGSGIRGPPGGGEFNAEYRVWGWGAACDATWMWFCKVLVSLIYIEPQTDYDDNTSSEQMRHVYLSSENYLIMMNDLVQPEE